MPRTSRAVSIVEAGLDEFFAYQRARKRRKPLRHLTRRDMVGCVKRATGIKHSADQMSSLLSQYRDGQGLPNAPHKYEIAARGYGPGARWYVLSGPGLNTQTGEGMTMAHAEWVSRDLSKRMTSDYIHEILPAAAEHTMIQPRIEATRVKIEQALNGLLSDVRQDKTLWEQANNRTAAMIEQMTAADAAMLSSLLNGDQP